MARFRLVLTRFRSVMRYILRKHYVAYIYTNGCWLIRVAVTFKEKIANGNLAAKHVKEEAISGVQMSWTGFWFAKFIILCCHSQRTTPCIESIYPNLSITKHPTIHLRTDVRSKKGSYSSLKMACHYIMYARMQYLRFWRRYLALPFCINMLQQLALSSCAQDVLTIILCMAGISIADTAILCSHSWGLLAELYTPVVGDRTAVLSEGVSGLRFSL